MMPSHLDPRMGKIIEAPVRERISYILADRYLPYPRAERVIEEIDACLDRPSTHRPKCLLIFGAPGVGKTMILDEAWRRQQASCSPHQVSRPLVKISLGGVSDLRSLFGRILRELDSPYSIKDRLVALYEQACFSIKARETQVLIIDELHNLLLHGSKIREAMAVIRDLANLPLSLVCAGTNAAWECIAADPQLQHRFRCHALNTWLETHETRNILATLESRLPLRNPSGLANSEMMPMLVRMSQGHPQTMITAIREAGRDALERGDEAIRADVLKQALQRLLEEKYEAVIRDQFKPLKPSKS